MHIPLILTRHGLSQRGSPFSDGTPESQFAIRPNDTYIYEFLLEDDAGTYFYHSHIGISNWVANLGMQAATCFGVIVIEPASDCGYPFEFDDERIVTFSDFWHASDDKIESGLLNSTVSTKLRNVC
jgi:L-ascorbate oxidase